MEWWFQYIGLPWVSKATGPDAYDCWGLVVHVLRKHFSTDANEYENIATSDHRAIQKAILQEMHSGKWRKIEKPQAGAVVLMSSGRMFHHIGIMVDSDKILHTHEKTGCCLESVKRVEQNGLVNKEFWINERIASRS